MLDFGEIDAVQHDLRRVQPAESGLHGFVDLTVIGNGGFPAHAAEETDFFHEVRTQKYRRLWPLGWEHLNLTGDYAWRCCTAGVWCTRVTVRDEPQRG